jgi:phosphoribosylformylglycinamidine synthase subunit PurS
MKYEIRTFFRPGILDQQGQAVAKALNELGWPEVVSCRIGKVYEIEYNGENPFDCDKEALEVLVSQGMLRILEKEIERFENNK